jgi:hypothetical protein
MKRRGIHVWREWEADRKEKIKAGSSVGNEEGEENNKRNKNFYSFILFFAP